MDFVYVFSFLFWSGLVWCLRADCPDVMSLMMNVEECVGVLEAHKGKTLRGELNQHNKAQACQDYRDSIKCLDDIIASCQGRRDQHSKETAMQFRKDQKGGFGQLCENQTYFGEYLSFSRCFRRVSAGTEQCLDNFTRAHETEMCSSIKELDNCVDRAVTPFCGPDAKEFYFELCKYQVPSIAFSHCYTTPIPRPTTTQLFRANSADRQYKSVYYRWLTVPVIVVVSMSSFSAP